MKVGFLIDTDEVLEWEADLVRRIINTDFVRTAVLVQIGNPPGVSSRSWIDRLARIPLRVVRWLESRKLRKSSVHWQSLMAASLSKFDLPSIDVTPVWSSSGLSWRLSEHDLERIAEIDCDVLVRLCSGIIRGAVLDLAEYGILSIHHGDNRRYRGVPPGFWEVFNREASSGFTIQRLSEELDGGQVVARGSVTTQTYFLRNQAHIFVHSVPRFVSILGEMDLSAGGSRRYTNGPYQYQLWRDPGPLTVGRYFFKQLWRLMTEKLRGRFVRSPTWGVAITHSPWQEAVLWKARELESLPGTWLADPFLLEYGERIFCFVEEFVESAGRGRIALFEAVAGGFRRLGVALDEEFHLSFPYVFVHENVLYMCPETSEAGQIRLYRSNANPLAWELCEVLVDNVVGVDPMVFRRRNEWVLWVNLDEAGTGDFGAGVWEYTSKSLTGSLWTLTQRGPVFSDGDGLRNGGLLLADEGVIRVGQISDFAEYGSGVRLQKIQEATGVLVEEDYVDEIRPKFRRGIHGIHHMSATSSLTAIDVYR